MSIARIVSLTSLAMLAFAGNSLLCRLALKFGHIDAASFTSVRLASGALSLWLLVTLGKGTRTLQGGWISALALFAYAAGFSFAYLQLSAGTGALLLFGAVQATMIGRGIWIGERLSTRQVVGLLVSIAGLGVLLLPSLETPPLRGSALMLCAGVGWGVYSLRGKGAGDPLAATAGNFVRAVPLAFALSAWTMNRASWDATGLACAVVSGALTSGAGYAIWYAVLPTLKAARAATVQLSVPALAGLGGVAILGESLTLRLVLASAAILGGIALVILERRRDE